MGNWPARQHRGAEAVVVQQVWGDVDIVKAQMPTEEQLANAVEYGAVQAKDSVDKLYAAWRRERARANEAARLSAQARDDNDDLRRQITQLQDRIDLLEGDRDMLQRRLRQYGLSDDLGEW